MHYIFLLRNFYYLARELFWWVVKRFTHVVGSRGKVVGGVSLWANGEWWSRAVAAPALTPSENDRRQEPVEDIRSRFHIGCTQKPVKAAFDVAC